MKRSSPLWCSAVRYNSLRSRLGFKFRVRHVSLTRETPFKRKAGHDSGMTSTRWRAAATKRRAQFLPLSLITAWKHLQNFSLKRLCLSAWLIGTLTCQRLSLSTGWLGKKKTEAVVDGGLAFRLDLSFVNILSAVFAFFCFLFSLTGYECLSSRYAVRWQKLFRLRCKKKTKNIPTGWFEIPEQSKRQTFDVTDFPAFYL